MNRLIFFTMRSLPASFSALSRAFWRLRASVGKATVFVGESESELLTNPGGPLVDEEDDLPRFLYDFFRRVVLLLLLR